MGKVLGPKARGRAVAWLSVAHALWLFLPAYVANMSPVITARLLPRWNAPMDGGRTDAKGHRILGPGKTWRGLAGGALAAGLTAVAMAVVAPAWDEAGWLAGWDFGHHGYPGGPLGDGPTHCDAHGCIAVDMEATPLWTVFLFGAAVGTMALFGDAVKSFFKRRRGKKRGAPWVPFDQLDFVVFGLLGMWLASPMLADGWVAAALLDDWVVLATLLLLTPVLHLLVNVVGHRLGLKEVPW